MKLVDTRPQVSREFRKDVHQNARLTFHCRALRVERVMSGDADLPRWLHGYNWQRPHASLAGQPPISRLQLKRNNLMRLQS